MNTPQAPHAPLSPEELAAAAEAAGEKPACFKLRRPIEQRNDPKTTTPPAYVVGGLYALGQLTMIYSLPGLGKTMLGFQNGLAVAAGKDFLGRPTRRTRCIYGDLEMPEWGEVVRQNALAKHLGIDLADPGLEFVNLPAFIQETSVTLGTLEKGLENGCRELGWDFRDLLLVIDTFTDISPDSDKNDSREMGVALDILRDMARKRNLAIVVFHHSNKIGGFLGSQTIKGKVDNLFGVRWAEKDERNAWEQRRKELGLRQSGKAFIVAVPEKTRLSFGKAPLHLTQHLLPRDDSIPHDEYDTNETDGFAWGSLGFVGREELAEEAMADADAETMFGGQAAPDHGTDAPPGTANPPPPKEPIEERRGRQVAEAFAELSLTYTRQALQQRYMAVYNVRTDAARKAIDAARQLGFIRHTTAGDNTTPFALAAPKGNKAWTAAHGTETLAAIRREVRDGDGVRAGAPPPEPVSAANTTPGALSAG